MSYALYYSNGNLFTNLDEQAIDTASCSLGLAGRGVVSYGATVGQNFVYLLENFANTVPPANPLIGQIWYDTSAGLMKVWGSGKWTAFANVGGLGNTVGLSQGTTLAGYISNGNRMAGSTGVILIDPKTGNSTTVGLMIAEGRIVSAASAETLSVNALPASISIQGSQLSFSGRFPNGIKAGVTLATDTAGYVNAGLATSTLYADIAERYQIDVPCEPGDVVSIGGEAEITISKAVEDTDVIGVVSTNPALRMNDEAGPDSTHPLVALLGRVPCKVVGPIRKGQRLVSAGIPGVAKAAEGGIDSLSIIGRALENKTSIGIDLVLILVGRS